MLPCLEILWLFDTSASSNVFGGLIRMQIWVLSCRRLATEQLGIYCEDVVNMGQPKQMHF